MIGKTLGTYEILSPLGKGGMGEVWRARDQKLGREVAIKTLPEEFAQDEERLARFEREAKLLEVAPVCGQLGGLFKVYSGCRSSCQNLLGSIFLSPLLRRWVSGQGA